jgi:hypothetical protein
LYGVASGTCPGLLPDDPRMLAGLIQAVDRLPALIESREAKQLPM